MGNHNLKTWPKPFQDIWDGIKLFEYRLNDRSYSTGDILYLKEYDPDTDAFSGRGIQANVIHIMYGGGLGLPNEMCIMSIVVSCRAGSWSQVKGLSHALLDAEVAKLKHVGLWRDPDTEQLQPEPD